MGRRGPKPEPTSLKILKGTANSWRKEPRPKPIIPRIPAHLDSIARKEWKRIAPELDRMGLLTCVDGAALEAYCVAYSNMVEAQYVLSKYGMTFTTKNGYVQQRPEVGIVNRSLMIIRAFCAEFGLSPSARARMCIPDLPDEDDPMEQLLRS